MKKTIFHYCSPSPNMKVLISSVAIKSCLNITALLKSSRAQQVRQKTDSAKEDTLWAVVMYAFNHSTQEAEAGRSL